jgi:FKBP-type peptidyl-prolyl cis-trans isomerase FkpA
MITRIIPVAMLGALIIGNTGCKSGGDFKKLKGIEYKIVKDVPGKTAQMGDIVEFHMLAKADTFTLADTRMQGNPAPIRVEEVKGSGQFQAVFPMVSVGDSVIVEISCDTLIANIPAEQRAQQQLPPWLKKGNKIKINMSIVAIKNMDDYKKDMEKKQEEMQRQMKEKAAQQMPVDDRMLQDYFAKNNIKAQKTASGLYYTIQKPGSGPNVAKGQVASVRYTGKTLDGKVFDSNVDTTVTHNSQLLTVPVGAHNVIPGMDEGLELLKKGSKATLYMPSPLAYGPQSPSPAIPANSILIFDVEIVDVKAGAPMGGPEGPGAPPAPTR